MKKYKCFCCGYQTLDTRGEYDICPVCFWEDDAYLIFSEKIKGIYYDSKPSENELLDIPSEANDGLTLRQGQENYRSFQACKKELLPYVRKPNNDEKHITTALKI